MLGILGMRSDEVCLIVALDVKLLPWSGLLLCIDHTQHTYVVTAGTKATTA